MNGTWQEHYNLGNSLQLALVKKWRKYLPKLPMNVPKTDPEVPSKGLNKFYYEALYHDCVNFNYLHKSICDKKKSLLVMESEQMTLCEINACLWVKAVNSATHSLTKHTYAHYIIVQKFINYLLTADSTENFGLIENYFWKLLLSHPPSAEMFYYYSHILFDNFVCLNGTDIETQSLFFWLMETITNCLKIQMDSDEDKNLGQSTKRPELSVKTRSTCLMEIKKETFDIVSNKSSQEEVTQKQIDFNKLPVEEKIKRCLLVLNLIYKILETDFIIWLEANELKPPSDNNRPLLSKLLWKNYRDIGLVNEEIQKLYQLYKFAMNVDFPNIRIIEKLVTLVGEIIRWSDSFEEMKYPFVGKNSVNFSRQLSLALHHRLADTKINPEENERMVKFKLPWLRLFVCSQLLTLISSHQCFPELTGIYDILEFIVNEENKHTNREKTPIKSLKAENSLSKVRNKFENVNTILKNGKTHLHLACENSDTGKIKTLLSFSELDVNAVDQNGWTPLHLAAYEGKITCVQELLLFNPEQGGAQKSVNTRAQGPDSTTPLMCAAQQGHMKICKLLLEHSGSILLEDVNKFNQTALEIAKESAVKRLLKHYKSNNQCNTNSVKNIYFDSEFKKVVIRLCVEMIQAYFSTYKTREICKRLNKLEKTAFDVEFYYDYLRYDRDINTNINQLKSLFSKLESIEEFKSFSDIYITILSLHKKS